MTVVVDASLALKWVLDEEGTEEALALWDRWQGASELLVAPSVFGSEVTNALHQSVRRGNVSPPDALEALGYLLSIVRRDEPPDLYYRGLALAGFLSLGSTYDALYLALAESQGCEMWTADRRFVRAAQERFESVRWIGEVP